MGNTSCSRLNCSGVMEECATKVGHSKHNSLWADCGGAPTPGMQVHPTKAGLPGSDQRIGVNGEAIDVREPEVGLTASKFAVCRNGSHSSGNGPAASRWSNRYTLGRELGAGQTAVVFEAWATPSGIDEQTGEPGPQPEDDNPGRRVALKRFSRAGTSMFRQEVRALKAVDVHPNVMRLLESYEGGEDEDVLILEYCEGGDVYELYAANNGCGMLEAFVAQLLRQLLSALKHLTKCYVEHRDVKPENLLLYGPSDRMYPCLKLADFGWAVVNPPNSKPPVVPAEGVGSLWYAPPELNPPVKGMEELSRAAPIGRSDMWSVGVIAYLLLVGHSPFNLALRSSDSSATEKEVIRLAAFGEINTSARVWPRLSPQAQSFITALVRPNASKRPLPAEALNHPFILQNCKDLKEDIPVQLDVVTDRERQLAWASMDGFQRLCWLAIARAVSEPELLEARTSRSFTFHSFGQGEGSNLASASLTTGYLEYLASELVVVAVPSWFQSQVGWADVMYLAYSYLDTDCDNVLSVNDLRAHVNNADKERVQNWIPKWQRSQLQDPQHGLRLVDFRWTLWSTCIRRVQNIQEDSCPYEMDGGGAAYRGMQPSRSDIGGDSIEAAVVQRRMQAIEEICERYIDEVLYPEHSGHN